MKFSNCSPVAFALLVLLATTTWAQTTTKTSAPAAAATTDFILPSAAPPVPPAASSKGPSIPGPTSNPTAAAHCPGPLIENIHNLSIATCLGSCCIKCPAVESFYEPNKVQNVLQGAYVTRQVSLVSSAFMAVSYLVLPGKRSQPHISVLFLTVSLSLWYAAFDVMPGVSNACINDFEQSTGHNSRLCGIQGVLIIYFTQTSALWCSLLIYKLHLLAVWRSDLIDRYYVWLTGVCWILPLCFAIPVAVRNLAEYPGVGFSCLVNTSNLNTYLFYPTAVYMYPSMLCHVVTVGRMIQMALLSSRVDAGMSQLSSNARTKLTATRQAKRLLRGQWRPALMLATVMSALTVFWLFYFVDAHRLASLGPTTEWLQQWVICVMTNGAKGLSSDATQTLCAVGTKPHLPSLTWFTAAESLLAIIGIVVALVFIGKVEFWSEWSYLLANLFSRGISGSGSRGCHTPTDDSAPAPAGNLTLSPGDEQARKEARNGFNSVSSPLSSGDIKSMSSTRHLNGENQWYDMDDLLGKEYAAVPGQMNHQQHYQAQYGLQRNLSSGSRSDPIQLMPEPPKYQSPQSHGQTLEDLYGKDILYRSPTSAQDGAVVNAWTPSAQTLTSPTRAYLVANDNNERYVEQPVVPTPVPRASLKLKKQQQQEPEYQSQVFLSNSQRSPTLAQQQLSQYPMVATTSLSPMPQKIANQATFSGSLPRQITSDSVPIANGVRGSPATGYMQPGVGARAFDSNDGGAQIMVASRESIGASAQLLPAMLDQRNKTPLPPSVPMKSPARHQPSQNSYYSQQQSPEPCYMSPTHLYGNQSSSTRG
ncbi:hypothetical protein EMPS_08735 [Entomortierella parvispora]|uniref:G-protein coupled receptors family 2 profile 2 domain-containing protein n=1 Tax=Entomortierella parvispora TaxID=205924 RepID=A0A9P3LZD7_9FUNG|nr:hypothetical protein EMPS_08735 [Entomortierella parvispora]